MTRQIKTIFINVNSIVARHRRHYLRLFLDRHKPDVLLIAEHKLNSRHKLYFDGYLTFRQNRHTGQGGGTAVLIRDSLSCERILIDAGNIEATAVRIHRVNGGSLTVVSLYRRPLRALSVGDLGKISDLANNGSTIIGADLNARHPSWGDSVTDTSGRSLHGFLLASPNLEIHPTDGPTRITQTSSSFIDIMMTSADLTPLLTGNGLRTLDYESDHRAVEFVLGIGDCLGRIRPTIYDFGRMNRDQFNATLKRELAGCALPVDSNVGAREIDACVQSMSLVFKKAMDFSIPKIVPKKRGLIKLPPNILRFIAEKKRLRRLVRRCEDPIRCLQLKADIKNLDRIIQGAIAVLERDRWTDFLSNIKVNQRTFKTIKAAAGLSRRKEIHNLTDVNGSLVSDEGGKANLLAEHFSNIHRGDHSSNGNSFSTTVSESVSILHNRVPLVSFSNTLKADGSLPNDNGFIRAEMIGDALKRRANKKSCGVDGIPDIVLKKIRSDSWKFLAVLYNHCLNVGYFPAAWKKALVVPILKPKSDPRETGNYRPISLLSPFGKLLEHFLLEKIKDKIADGGILIDSQFGFKSGHSTTHALTVFSDFVAKGLNRRYPTIAVSLDFAKAFDTAWQEGIIYKMMNLGFDRNLCRMASSFLSNRTFRVKVGEKESIEMSVAAGVPQGSLLGPVLYNVLVCDIPKPPDGNLLLMYADDILIAFAGRRARNTNGRLNEYLGILEPYFRKWRLRINMSKTEAVIIKGRKKYLYPNSRRFIPSLMIGNELISVSDRIKYLGVIFHENFEFYRHIDHVLERTKRTYATYRAILGHQRGLDKKVGLLLYRQVIRPIMSYAFPVWFRLSSAQMERLRIWERRILVACLGLRHRLGPDGIYRRPSNRSVYAAIEFERIDSFMVRTGIAFLEKARSLENGLVQECYESSGDLESVQMSRYMSPVDLLTLRDADLLYSGANLLFYHRRINTLNINNIVYSTAQ